MSLNEFAYWLDETPASVALKDNVLAVPVAQSVHILAVAFVLSGSVLLSLRSVGIVGTDWTMQDWSRKLNGRLWIALGLLLLSGSLLVLAEPPRELVNPVFQIKLFLVIPTVVLAAWLARRQVNKDAATITPLDKIASLILVLLWVAIVCAGRWIAYI
ncbi:MAG: conserved hypothetical rane protein [Sphingomonadales bacterium]|nr:conserved hypothetical rane protein [Sphingomonadales bacterium]